ncbi:MAG: hypothetical protein ACYST6_05725 [Planctomycetota bacterium]|jgi:hypothetical protein
MASQQKKLLKALETGFLPSQKRKNDSNPRWKREVGIKRAFPAKRKAKNAVQKKKA